jgi:LysW-gamma-L-lysine carboxypeptidase
VEEEHPSSKGARALARAAPPRYCVIGEPSGWDAITVGYKGSLQIAIALERGARHGAHEGTTIAEDAIAIFEALRRRADARAPEGGAFDRVDCRLARIDAGPADGLVDRAEMRVAYRIPPGLSSGALVDDARAVVSGHGGGTLDARLEVLAREEPVRASRATPLANAFRAAIHEAGGEPRFKVKTGTSDMNVLAPAWRCPILAYGPGDSRYDHTPMERLPLADYARSIAVLRAVLRDLAGASA